MKRKGVILFWCMTLLSVAAIGQSVKIYTEKGVDLTKFETFMVIKGELTTPPDTKKIDEEALFQSIKMAVVREMELRGYKHLDDSAAQLYVSYVAGSYNLTDSGITGPLGQTPASNPSDMNQDRSWTKTSREGMLVLDISESRGKKEIWNATTSNLALDNVDFNRALDAVVYKAFRKFPDKNKKQKKKR